MSQYIFPRLQDNKEFENLMADCYRMGLQLPPEAVDVYGRNGQKQYGIDVTIIYNNELWCIQCKNQMEMSVDDVKNLIEKCTFHKIHPFQKLIIATAAPGDTHIVDYLNEVRRAKQVPYVIEYLPWERICSYIENTLGVYQKYYKKLDIDDPLKNSFFEMVKKYNIPAFLRLDPLVEGVPSNVPVEIDSFVAELQVLLDNYIGRNDYGYRKIYEFRYAIDNYSGTLAVTLFMDPKSYSRFIYIPPYGGIDTMYEEKKNTIDYCRNNINQLLLTITNI